MPSKLLNRRSNAETRDSDLFMSSRHEKKPLGGLVDAPCASIFPTNAIHTTFEQEQHDTRTNFSQATSGTVTVPKHKSLSQIGPNGELWL